MDPAFASLRPLASRGHAHRAVPFPFISQCGVCREDLHRGGTAPGPPETDRAHPQRNLGTSHKYAVQAMGVGNVTIRGAGYSSSTSKSYMLPTACSVVKTQAQALSLRRPGEEAKFPRRPEPIRPRYKSGEELEIRPSDGNNRPPTRQLSPKDAVGLELPAKPVTPPECDSRFDCTWSYSVRTHKETPTRPAKRVESRRTSSTSLRKSAPKPRDSTPIRPPSIQAWVEPTAKAMDEVSTKTTPYHRSDLPKVVGKGQESGKTGVFHISNRRTRSAAPGRGLKSALTAPGNVANEVELRSSLGSEFLGLFK